jgi:para-nitrobenzyl esterase
VRHGRTGAHHRTSVALPDVTTIRRALGIPYATAGRYELPVPVAFDAGRAADAFGPAAPQSPGDKIVPGSYDGPTDEHACLTVNVWAPAGADRRPVMLWYHGGSFSVGSSSQPMYDGTRLAIEQNVVVVSANYRIGALGFLDTRPLGGDHANVGLHDAALALRWTREHVAHFGGDPENITIFGESSGGGLCAHLLATPSVQDARRAIIQSGITHYTLETERAEVVTRAFADALGVTDYAGLLAAPVDAVLAAQVSVFAELLGSIGMMPFHPCIDRTMLHETPARAIAAGSAADTTLLAGTTADEMRLYLDPGAPMPERERFVRRVGRYTGVGPDDAEAIVTSYEANLRTDSLGEVWAALFTDMEMLVPLREVLDAQAKHQPTYAYLFDWKAPQLGAFHAVDLPFTFNTFDVDGWEAFVGADEDAFRIGRELRRAWGRFATTGEPGWEAYPAVKVFARTSSVEPEHPSFARLPVR